ncbi:hypothetical protein A2G06_16720 (plasmid) [Geobacter anodireducens]|nr:hypothetical protein A2G06_16720 [Geobacter anodireducens]
MQVRAISRHELAMILSKGGAAHLENGTLSVITIKGSDEQWEAEPHPNVLALTFDDVEPRNGINPRMIELTKKEAFSEEHANKVREFLLRLKDRGQCRCLAVSCEKGISRSGAIALFAVIFLKVPIKEFCIDNPHISPNLWVLNVLAVKPMLYYSAMAKSSLAASGGGFTSNCIGLI